MAFVRFIITYQADILSASNSLFSYNYLIALVTGEGNCTFERNEDCFLENSKLDDFDWTIKSVSCYVFPNQ